MDTGCRRTATGTSNTIGVCSKHSRRVARTPGGGSDPRVAALTSTLISHGQHGAVSQRLPAGSCSTYPLQAGCPPRRASLGCAAAHRPPIPAWRSCWRRAVGGSGNRPPSSAASLGRAETDNPHHAGSRALTVSSDSQQQRVGEGVRKGKIRAPVFLSVLVLRNWCRDKCRRGRGENWKGRGLEGVGTERGED